MNWLQTLKAKFVFQKKEKELTIPFYGFDLFYSEGTSIVERLNRTGTYEPDTLKAVNELLNLSKGQTMIDIGANIGFISLFALHVDPTTQIYAFEPGPHQFKLFEKTILKNQLEKKIKLTNVALSNKNGFADFSIHNSSDASGDGFIDTKRAGKTRKIKVTTETLDSWWLRLGKPPIDVMKMDTEGSEYWILKGGESLIRQCRPKILIEINDKNLKNYPFTVNDVLKLIENLGYKIKSLAGEEVNRENWNQVKLKEDTFLLE